MFTIETVLHPTDFSPCARSAFAHALRMARRHGATLHLLNAAPSLGEDPIRSAYDFGTGEGTVYQEMETKAQQLMAELIEAADAEDVEIVLAHERGIAAGPVILGYVESNDVDLIVMGTHGRRGVKRFVLGSVTEEVVRRATCSVLTVRGAHETGAPLPAIERMLVPVDLSEFTVPLFRAAKDVAATYGAGIDLLHVVEPLPFPIPLIGGITLHDLVPDPTGRAAEQLTHLIETVDGPDVDAEAHVVEGHAAGAIVEQAEELGSDLVMIASHGLSGLEGLLLGSVTARVVRKATPPVLVARVTPEATDTGTPSSSETTVGHS